ncbi:hypothetical protein VCV51_032655 [Vibrio cholerae V51]|uniref:Uncharacterized protein n=1 Tax=Vibrio cholerae TaxID=666 RepID=A0A2U8JDS5_VIBCL|nr:hypothetical protein [Vibrio cholerae]AWK60078.1 hypothetical protein [Vibrio cholerae]KNA58423.1 hypothetical protein VCV51_032655 [Vibrio cholerae V51]QBH68059.1 hypothetical protein [Vibrio cholerae]
MRCTLYIELDASHKAIPKVGFVRPRHSNLIKRSELATYQESKALIMALEEKVKEYQKLLEEQVLLMLEEKEQLLNSVIEEEYQKLANAWKEQQIEWFKVAENELARHLKEQEEAILDVKRELKHQIASEVQARLTKLTQSEKLISHLVEVLHSEMDDACKALQVETEQHEDGVTLSIENEDRIISIDSKTIIEELKRGLESI